MLIEAIVAFKANPDITPYNLFQTLNLKKLFSLSISSGSNPRYHIERLIGVSFENIKIRATRIDYLAIAISKYSSNPSGDVSEFVVDLQLDKYFGISTTDLKINPNYYFKLAVGKSFNDFIQHARWIQSANNFIGEIFFFFGV